MGSQPLKLGPRTAVVILNWNGWKDTVGLLDSLSRIEYRPVTVVVLDNASTDDSVPRLESWLKEMGSNHRVLDWDPACRATSLESGTKNGDRALEFVVIKSPQNLGFCVGNNVGMGWAFADGADYVLVLNNDTLVSPGFLTPMVETARSDPQVGLVGGVITYCAEPETVWWAGGKFNRFLTADRLHDGEHVSGIAGSEPYETDWISGCMMLIPSQVFSAMGGFDEDYFIWSEEWDYSIRVAAGGHKLVVCPAARVCHKVGRSLGIMQPLNYYYGNRNALLFKRKHLPRQIWYPYFAVFLINRILRFTQLALLGRTDLARAGIAAVADFVRGRTGEWGRQGRGDVR